MAKSSGSGKSRTARKPPAPADGHAVIQEWMQDVMPRLQPIVKRVDAMVREAIPGLQYAVKWKKAFYGTPERGWIIEMVAYDVSVNVVFFGGAQLDPPPPLGKGSRYVKLVGVEDADTPEMRKWLRQAKDVPGWQAK